MMPTVHRSAVGDGRVPAVEDAAATRRNLVCLPRSSALNLSWMQLSKGRSKQKQMSLSLSWSHNLLMSNLMQQNLSTTIVMSTSTSASRFSKLMGLMLIWRVVVLILD
jgi:hypothetical protein